MKLKITAESNWKNYLAKAEQFNETARDAYQKENWNAVGLNAVHAAISANDAITVYYKKIRSASENHGDAAGLLLETLSGEKDAKQYAKHLIWLISRKNLIEYESRLFYMKEAEAALKHADRFLMWVKSRFDS